MKCVLDTNVYLHAMRSEAGRAEFEQRFVPLLFRTYLSSVVAEELFAGALDAAGIALVDRHLGALRRAGRVIAPSTEDWIAAGKLIARITRKEPDRKSKVQQQLLNDILIALSARRIGATVFTFNRDDFELIGRHRLSSGPVTVTLSLDGADHRDQASCRTFGRGKSTSCR